MGTATTRATKERLLNVKGDENGWKKTNCNVNTVNTWLSNKMFIFYFFLVFAIYKRQFIRFDSLQLSTPFTLIFLPQFFFCFFRFLLLCYFRLVFTRHDKSNCLFRNKDLIKQRIIFLFVTFINNLFSL